MESGFDTKKENKEMNDQQECRLFKLPAELRIMIYEQVFTSNDESKVRLLHAEAPTDSLPLSCQRIHQEASSTYKKKFREYWIEREFVLVIDQEPGYHLFCSDLPLSQEPDTFYRTSAEEILKGVQEVGYKKIPKMIQSITVSMGDISAKLCDGVWIFRWSQHLAWLLNLQPEFIYIGIEDQELSKLQVENGYQLQGLSRGPGAPRGGLVSISGGHRFLCMPRFSATEMRAAAQKLQRVDLTLRELAGVIILVHLFADVLG